MATGLYVVQDGSVMVAYGPRHIPISYAQYKANGYKPALEKLVAKSPDANKPWSVLRPPKIVDWHVKGSHSAHLPSQAFSLACWRESGAVAQTV